DLWQCLTCDLCRVRCRSDVNLPEFIRRLRLESIKLGNAGFYSHNNVFHLISKIQLRTGEHQKRLNWVPSDIKYLKEGQTLFFVGCAPYFQTIFKEMNQDNLATPIASLKLLNHTGIEPVLLKSERCCGHDAFWTGHQSVFEQLMEQNIQNFKNAGVEKIITACPEGHYMLNEVYREYSDKYDFECLHITEFLADKIDKGELVIPRVENTETEEIVSYHDPCRLGRFSGIYEPPRQIIEAIPGVVLNELSCNRKSSTCCGVSSFMNCDINSKSWRQAKLQDAAAQGAQTLLTTCPKCTIHLDCYASNEHIKPRIDIKVESLIVKLADKLNLMPKK
ncbi:MAG: (Fe-S)-binding protein, partial [Thermoplasmata archaeon]